MTTFKRTLVWLRRDLRLSDQTALSEAERLSETVIVAFVFDTNILNELRKDDKRMTFIHRSLSELNQTLEKKGSRLLVLRGDPVELIPKAARTLHADSVFTNRDYEPYARLRDSAVDKKLIHAGIVFRSYKDHVIFEGTDVLKADATPYKVYTPYKKAWLWKFSFEAGGFSPESALARPDENPLSINTRFPASHPVSEKKIKLRTLLPAEEIDPIVKPWTMKQLGFVETELWLTAGEAGAKRQLHTFIPKLGEYMNTRDVPSLDGTSGLSAHLRFGTISIRELVRTALAHPSEGSDVWLSELIWRDFYSMILYHFPHVADHAFRKELDQLHWAGKNEHFQAWCEGRTGFPIVDATMRNFSATGWMHNRLRMVVAMFLTKDLLIDWRKGEQYFAEHLLDFDLASNNGGWQWSASTGCDAQPYFRIFNPVLQSTKFDPDGDFIRRNCPELARFSNRRIHAPWEADIFEQQQANCVIGTDYPFPIVDHQVQKEKAIAMFKREEDS